MFSLRSTETETEIETHGLPKVVGGLNPTFSLRPTETETEIETEAEESQEVDVSSMVTQLEANLWDQRAGEVTRRDERAVLSILRVSALKKHMHIRVLSQVVVETHLVSKC